MSAQQPIGIYYEHPHWFVPLFIELDRRGLPYERINATSHTFEPARLNGEAQFSVLFNRMSPSAYRRGHASSIFYTQYFLGHLEHLGKRVINGSASFRYETSKALQLSLLGRMKLPHPKTRVIHDAADAPAGARELRFPIVIKPNIGGSGAGIVCFDTPEQIVAAVEAGAIDLGLDCTALVQEFVPARGGYIVRVEFVGRKYLYAIKVYLNGETFDLCPADICKGADGVTLRGPACPVDAAKAGLRVEAYEPPAEVIEGVERIASATGIDVGGVEYLIDDRDGQRCFYDINALSNFVSDGPALFGFDPFARLVDYLEKEAR
jgi:ribosomal protein S6-L-glutamate ligase RimK-like protein